MESHRSILLCLAISTGIMFLRFILVVHISSVHSFLFKRPIFLKEPTNVPWTTQEEEQIEEVPPVYKLYQLAESVDPRTASGWSRSHLRSSQTREFLSCRSPGGQGVMKPQWMTGRMRENDRTICSVPLWAQQNVTILGNINMYCCIYMCVCLRRAGRSGGWQSGVLQDWSGQRLRGKV